jgi:hypothetical protein
MVVKDHRVLLLQQFLIKQVGYLIIIINVDFPITIKGIFIKGFAF